MKHILIALATVALTAQVGAQEPKTTNPAAALQGTWVLTSMNGQNAPEGSPEISLTFTGEKYQQAIAGEVNERGTFTVDASKKPMSLDLVITEGGDAGKTQVGIFEVTGDSLRVNFAAAGDGQRPADFTAKEGGVMFAAKKKKA
jgi:uncharacterized protein (TIGR03067 family)